MCSVTNAADATNIQPLLADDDGLSGKRKDSLAANTCEPINVIRGSSFKQILIALSVSWGNINTGLLFGYTAVSLPQLEITGSRITVNNYQASWITSVSSIGTLFGCILSGYLCDRLGRKRTLIVLQFPAIMGWLMIGFASSIQWIYVGRILVGISSGMVGAPSRVYIAEMSQPYIRGMLGGFASVGVSLGVMLVYMLGSVFNWDTLAFVSAIFPITSIFLTFIIPESPTWLMSKRKETLCRTSLRRLRDSKCDVDAEVNNLVLFFKTNESTSIQEKFQLIYQPSTYKPFVILSLYFLLSQFSGFVVITCYAVEIIKDSGTNINNYTVTIMLGFIRLVFTIIGCILMRRFGRKQLSYVSSLGCGIPMLCFAGYMFQNSKWLANDETTVAVWFPVLCLFLFCACSTVGYLLVPWVLIGELFPKQIRGIMSGVTYCVANLMIFIVLQTYPLLQELITKPGTFALYGIISILNTCFFYYFCPETKDKTLQEIEESFGKRKTKTCMSEGVC